MSQDKISHIITPQAIWTFDSRKFGTAYTICANVLPPSSALCYRSLVCQIRQSLSSPVSSFPLFLLADRTGGIVLLFAGSYSLQGLTAVCLSCPLARHCRYLIFTYLLTWMGSATLSLTSHSSVACCALRTAADYHTNLWKSQTLWRKTVWDARSGASDTSDHIQKKSSSLWCWGGAMHGCCVWHWAGSTHRFQGQMCEAAGWMNEWIYKRQNENPWSIDSWIGVE